MLRTHQHVSGGRGRDARPAALCAALRRFNNYNTLVRSSYTDRGVLSGLVRLLGDITPCRACVTCVLCITNACTRPALPRAQSFFSGIFPANQSVATATEYLPTGQQLVPIYTQPDQDDYLIRAYTKCPTYDRALTTWCACSLGHHVMAAPSFSRP